MDNDDELLGLAEFAVEEFYKNQYEEKKYYENDELVEFAARDLLKKYDAATNPASTTFMPEDEEEPYPVLDVEDVDEPDEPDDSDDIEVFGLDDEQLYSRKFSFGFGTIQLTVYKTGGEAYYVSVDSTVFGIKLGRSELRFEDGVLSRTEEVSAGPVWISYHASVSFSDGFSLSFSGKGSFNYFFGKKKFSFGPLEFP